MSHSNAKRCIVLLLLCTLLLHVAVIPSSANGIPKPTREFYVNDFAGLLDDETKNYIIKVNEALFASTGAQIVVVTVNTLEDTPIEEFSTTLFREYGIGTKGIDNGILMLLALKERLFRIEVGYGLEGILNDSKTGRIQDTYIVPYLTNNQWNEAIRNGFNAIMEVLNAEYNTGLQTDSPNAIQEPAWLEDPNTIVFIFMIIALIGAIVIGKHLHPHCLFPNLIWIVFLCIVASPFVSTGFHIALLIIGCAVATLLGWAIGSPGDVSTPTSYTSERNDSPRIDSSSSSSSHSNRGGGGKSGGGGSTRKF